MQKLTERDLIEKHPLIFQDRYASPLESCLSFGIECGPGWYHILDVLFEKITEYCEKERFPSPKATQIKEKFGSLRVYMNVTTPYIDGLIWMAESITHSACEVCGAPAKKTGFDRGWLQVRCPEHSRSGGSSTSTKAVGRVSKSSTQRPVYEPRVPAYTKDGESIALLEVLNISLISYCESKMSERPDVKITEARIEDGNLILEAEGADEEAQGIIDMCIAYWKRISS